MKREYSLKGRKLFREVYRKGARFQKKGIQVFILKKRESKNSEEGTGQHKDGESLKIGITADKKLGTAVTRNKTKRRIRSICTDNIHKMNTGFYIIKASRYYRFSNFEDEEQLIQSLLSQAGAIKK